MEERWPPLHSPLSHSNSSAPLFFFLGGGVCTAFICCLIAAFPTPLFIPPSTKPKIQRKREIFHTLLKCKIHAVAVKDVFMYKRKRTTRIELFSHSVLFAPFAFTLRFLLIKHMINTDRDVSVETFVFISAFCSF